MKADEARKLTSIGEVTAKKEFMQYLQKQKEIKVAKRKEQKQEVKNIYSYCISAISSEAAKGQSSVNYTWSNVYDSDRKIAERVIQLLQRDGYTARYHTDTIFTGVDEWCEDGVISITWQK